MFQITVRQFVSQWEASKTSQNIFHGYVRYNIEEKWNAISFLSKVAQEFWSKGSYPKFIYELISIFAVFVKGGRFREEKEYRFLYSNITKKSIPHLYIPLDNMEKWEHVEVDPC